MKQTKYLLLIGTLSLGLFNVATTMAQSLGQWDFNSSNLVQSAGANLGDLQYANANTTSGTTFGTASSFGIPTIAGSNAVVMRFPIATNGMGYLMTTPPANGGGSLVNEWTLILDVLYPAASDNVLRPLIDTDGSLITSGGLVAGPDFAVSASNGVGAPPNGPFQGTITPNTWYRIGISVTTAEVDIYINGVQVGIITGTGTDGRFALASISTSLILGSITNLAGVGYVNSIQLRDSALNAGQMLALGGATGGGIPQTIPPVPSFIQTRSPAVNATRISPTPTIHVVLNQGDTIVNSGSIQLLFDGAALPGTSVVPTPPTFDINASVSSIQDPNSVHTLSLIWQDSVVGNKTNTWSFTVIPYQNANLPAPFYFEDFNSLTENPSGPGPLPAGWTVANQTTQDTPGYDISNRGSDSYRDWVLITSARFSTWSAERTALPPIVLNGTMLSILTDGNLMWAESDQRCGGCQGQYQELYTADINCTGRTNVFIAFKSIYEQNQDNMNCAEYSINQGASWLPVRYLFCTQGNNENSDIYYTNNASGQPVIDVGATFNTVDPNRNWSPDASPVHSTNYGIYIKAPISTALIPYIVGYTNDDILNGKEIVIVRLPQADGQAKVRFRFLDTGTSAWFWGIDDLGLYEINVPVISVQPQSQTIDAATPVTFTVVASSSTAITYQWKFNGLNIANATNSTYTITNVQPVNAGQYQVTVSNSDGPTKSSLATLTVVTLPLMLTQPSTQVADPGSSVSFTPTARGGRPLLYLWYKNSNLFASSSTINLSLNNVQPADSGAYQLIVTNSYGSVTSAVAQLTVFLASITNDLVVHLPFDGNFSDTSGRGNNAAYAHNGVNGDANPVFVNGKIGQAFEYSVTNDATKFNYATLGYPNDLRFGADVPFTVSMWLNYTNQTDDPPFISNKDWASSGNPGWGIFTQGDGTFRVNLTGPASNPRFSVTPSKVLRDGTWHNLVVSVARAPSSQSGIVNCYVDSVLVNSSVNVTPGSIDTADNAFTYDSHLPGVSTPVPTVQTTWAVNIGQDGTGVYYDNGSSRNINAHIDDVGIWRRALTGGEAKGLYNAGLSGKDLSQAIAVEKLAIAQSGGNVIINWAGNPALKLQKATVITGPWSDVSGTLGASTATIPITGSASFFRLTQ
jgi:hypothetical protein